MDEFFKTDDGLLHVGRVAVVVALICAVLVCIPSDREWSRIGLWLVSAVGWGAALGDKRPARTLAEVWSHPRRLFGGVLMVVGWVAPVYLSWLR